MATGTLTVTSAKLTGTGVSRYRLAWVSASNGSVTGNEITLPVGTIVNVSFAPDAGGTQPSDQYDVSLACNDHSVNVFDTGAGNASIGDNLSNAAGAHKVPFVGGGSVTYVRQWLHGGTYVPSVTNAGNAKGGTIDIFIAAGVI